MGRRMPDIGAGDLARYDATVAEASLLPGTRLWTLAVDHR